MSDIVPAIKVTEVSKSFRLPHERVGSLKNAIVNFTRKRSYENQHVLKGVSFEIQKGDFFGIVGRNGSGKSTLLKLLAGIYTADGGSIDVHGSLTPFIELGVGFNPELTGKENVFLNGALLGFGRSEMEKMYDDIVEFAELERFMDQKLKNYSSGMQVRLAFSIAIRADSDILILDEVLAVGDEAFQRKCNDYFGSLKGRKKTVVLVTHDMASVRKYCNKAILIKDGEIIVSGSPEDVANQYTLENFEVPEQKTPVVAADAPTVKITPISKQLLSDKDSLEFSVSYTVHEDIPVRFGISIIDELSGGSTSIIDDQIRDKNGKLKTTSSKKGTHTFTYKLPLNRFNNRDFLITATLLRLDKKNPENVAFTSGDDVGRFAIRGGAHDGGLLTEKGQWV